MCIEFERVTQSFSLYTFHSKYNFRFDLTMPMWRWGRLNCCCCMLANRLENIHLIASCVVQCFSCFTNHGCFRLFPLEHWTLSLPIGVECLQKFSKAFEHSYTYLQLCFELFSDKNWWDADWFSLDRGPVPFQRSPNLLEKKKRNAWGFRSV